MLPAPPSLPPIQVPTADATPAIGTVDALLPVALSVANDNKLLQPAAPSVANANTPLPEEVLSEAIRMYTAVNIPHSFRKDHIRAILHSVFDISISKSKSKQYMLDELKKQDVAQPNLIASAASPSQLPLVQLPSAADAAPASPALLIVQLPSAADAAPA